jgi:Asp/Glu/hydantoin racemase
MTIRWQSFVDPAQNAPYLARLEQYLNAIASPGARVEVRGISPPDRWFGRLTELRCGVVAVDNALQAEEDGAAAFVFGHFQEPGLYEARSACRIPVVGLGESSLLWASHLGRRLALVSIHDVFECWHLEQADLYGLGNRLAGVAGLGAAVEDFAPAFAGDEDAYHRLVDGFRSVASPLVERGADVVVPAGGLFALLTAEERDFRVGHAPVVNGIAVALHWAQTAVRLRELNGLEPSRGPSFASAPPQAVEEFRRFVRDGAGS